MQTEVVLNKPVLGKSISVEILPKAPRLEDYLDFRKYLADFYTYKCAQSAGSFRKYSYSVFSAAADIKSPNYLKMIIEGQRNLSDEMIEKFSKAMSLNKEQASEFKCLTLYGQATESAQRNLYLKELCDHRVNLQIKAGEINQQTLEKFPNWIAWIIYSMVEQKNVPMDAAVIKSLIRAKTTVEDVQASLDSMLKNGEIEVENGLIKRGKNAGAAAGEQIPSVLIRKLQSEFMYLGLESLFQDEATEREFGSQTLCLTKEEFEDLKFHLRKFRKQIYKDNSIKRLESKGDRVYQLNLQLYPITKTAENSPNLGQNVDKVVE